jgi:hypothetical protein
MNIRRGVKGGDPLSPFIFNAVLEPFLHLQEMRGFQLSDDGKVSSFAFADDIILVSSTASESGNIFRKSMEYLRGLDMSISSQKCAAFSVKSTRDSWHLFVPGLSSVNGEKFSFAGADTSLHYLGGTFSPWKGLIADNLDTEFRKSLERVQRLSPPPKKEAKGPTYNDVYSPPLPLDNGASHGPDDHGPKDGSRSPKDCENHLSPPAIHCQWPLTLL